MPAPPLLPSCIVAHEQETQRERVLPTANATGSVLLFG